MLRRFGLVLPNTCGGDEPSSHQRARTDQQRSPTCDCQSSRKKCVIGRGARPYSDIGTTFTSTQSIPRHPDITARAGTRARSRATVAKEGDGRAGQAAAAAGQNVVLRPRAVPTEDLEGAASRGGGEASRVSARTDVVGGRYQSESWVRHEVTEKPRAETGVGRTFGEVMEKCLSCLAG